MRVTHLIYRPHPSLIGCMSSSNVKPVTYAQSKEPIEEMGK